MLNSKNRAAPTRLTELRIGKSVAGGDFVEFNIVVGNVVGHPLPRGSSASIRTDPRIRPSPSPETPQLETTPAIDQGFDTSLTDHHVTAVSNWLTTAHFNDLTRGTPLAHRKGV